MDELLSNITNLLDKLLDLVNYPKTLPVIYDKYLHFFPILVLAFITAILLTPIIGAIAKKLNIYDRPPQERKVGLNKFDDPTRHINPRRVLFWGGLAVIIPLLLSFFLFLKPSPELTSIIVALVILAVVGALDDAFNLPATIQLGAQLLAATIIAFSVINLTSITNPFGGAINLNLATWNFKLLGLPWSFVFPGDIFIIPWIILCINAIKWMAGADGVMESNSIIIFVILFVLGVRNESGIIVITSIVTSGALLGFLFYNFPPAKIFSGASTKTTLGFLIATMALVNGAKIPTTIIVLALPIVDSLFVLGYRAIKFKIRNPFELLRINGTDHIHHQLIKMGLSFKGVILFESTITLFFGVLAVATTGANKLLALFSVLLIILIIISILNVLAAKKRITLDKNKKEESPESRYSY